jgi:type II secretory ATPase GspE/PulE/Tfp pilus assembly ATPase PilB-like protein
MKCDTCRELLTAYLKAELEDAQKVEVEEHLATCAECATESEGARRVLAEMDRASAPTIVALVEEIIRAGIERGASDIHLQPLQSDARVRLRIDGVLHDFRRLDTETHHALTDRCKILAGIPLAERRIGQDGRIGFHMDGKDYDLRVSVVPSIHGSAVVMRILDKSGVNLTLDQVQLVGEQRQQLNKMLYAPHGLVFVTGPTGSGKTTTLYAILHELNRPETSLMSIEDPVEYEIEGVTQMKVNRRMDFDFKTAMRHIMRQDPDIIMCGETRDLETAEVMAQAAITGHLVLGTLHTDDAVSVIRRLLDMGLDRFMITSSLLGATAQRLMRRICSECKEEYEPSDIERAWLQEAGAAEVPAKLWRGSRGGCDNCRNTGYRGRVAVYEIFSMDEDILQLMAVKKAPLEEIEKLAATKVKPMKLTAAEKVLAGETTAEEAMRVLSYLPEY